MAETLSFVLATGNDAGLTVEMRSRFTPRYIMVNAVTGRNIPKRAVIEIEYVEDNLLPLRIEHDYRWPPVIRQADAGAF